MADDDRQGEAFAFTDEQRELRAVVRDFCSANSDEGAVRRLMETEPGFDPAFWSRLGTDLGVLGLGVPEEVGGSGGGVVEAAILAEELGAALVCGPIIGTLALAIPALVAAPASVERDAALRGLLDGARTAALVLPDLAAGFAPSAVSLTATDSDAGWAVRGTVDQVVDGAVADDLVVPAVGPEGLVLLLVDAATSGVRRRPLGTLDRTRTQATVHFAEAPARLLATGADAERICRHALDVAAVLLAAEQVGVGQRMLDLSLAHARTRIQFGRPIGSFQAVKHRLADMYVDLEHARSAAYHAAWALQDGTDDARLVTSIAQAVCSDAATRVARDAVQVHGGIGFTWEHSAHLYLKRAYADAALLGGAEVHRDRVAALVLDEAFVSEGRVSVAAG